MASLTVDQLKKSLKEQGIALPPSGSKKADYVKLYEQYSTLNENLENFYSSDDENPPRSSSHSVTSSSSPSKIESIIKEVERLTDDELYNQLKELGASIGPVLKNTRKLYEKRLVKLLGGGGGQSNGVDTTSSRKSNSTFRVEEFSDSEVDLPSIKSSYRKEYKTSYSGRKSPVLRDSPKSSHQETVSEPLVEQRFSSQSYSDFDRKAPSFGDYTPEESRSSKFSFIETIPRGSTERYIEPSAEVEYPTSTFRSRFNTEKSNFGQDDYYTGTWEPNIKKYLGTQPQTKISKRPLSSTSASSSLLPSKASPIKENIIAVLIVLAFILLIVHLYFYLWSGSDPYKEIYEDAQRELELLPEKNDD